MIKFFNNWKKREFEKFLVQKKIEEEDARRLKAEAEESKKEENLRIAEAVNSNQLEVIKNSNEPWVTMESIVREGQVELKMDWNLAFIKFLKENGITGQTDEEIVQQYIRTLSYNIVDGEDLKNRFLENKNE